MKRKLVIPTLVSANNSSKLESKFAPLSPNAPKTAKIYECYRIFHPIWTIVRDVPNVFPIQMVQSPTFKLNVRKNSHGLTFANWAEYDIIVIEQIERKP